MKLAPGQLWWDKDHQWTDGSTTLDSVCLLLSADKDEGIYLWKVAQFIWCVDNYMGAPVKKFTEEEVRKMHYVGEIKQIKAFPRTGEQDNAN